MASSPEPAPGLGAFVVVSGAEDQCRPDAIRNFFNSQVGSCRIVTSSRSYSNEKTFVTLEFSSNSLVREAVDRFSGAKLNGCHMNIGFFKNRHPQNARGGGPMDRGGMRGNPRFQNGDRYNNNNNRERGWGGNRGQFQQRRGRSYGDLQGERMRGMSPNSAARFIEQRVAEKERRQQGRCDEHGRHRRSPSYSCSRSRSRSRSHQREYSRSLTPDDHSRSVSRSPRRSPLRSSRRKWRSASHSRSPSVSRLSPTPDHVVDEAAMSDDQDGQKPDIGDSSDSESGRKRRHRKRRKRHPSKSDVAVDEEAGNCSNSPAGREASETVDITVEAGLELSISDGLPAVTEKLLRVKRESLEQEFQADVSTIVSVTKLLMAQDISLEVGLQAALKGCVRDISQRYVEEFRTFTKANVQTSKIKI